MVDAHLDLGEYIGDMNATHQRHGKGVCKYLDGSHYDGEWQFNEKHG